MMMSSKRGPKMSEPSHERVLRFVRENPKPFVATTEVSESFDSVTKRTIYDRLDDLVTRGELKKHEVGASAVVWYLPVQRVEDASMSRPASDSQ
jgi:Fe2+ or Zn2+ uptake regulation protein